MADEKSAPAVKPVELSDDQIEQVAGAGDPTSTAKKKGGAQQEFLTVKLESVLISS